MNKILSVAVTALICTIMAISLPGKPAYASLEEADKDSILVLMSEAEFRTSYQGEVRIFNLSLAQPGVTQFWINHLTPNLERREYVNRREILINDGTNIWRYLPQQNLIIKRLSPKVKKNIQLIQRNISLIKQNYQVKISSGTLFLGEHRTLLVEFIPRWERNRPLRRVWIDSMRGIPLRTEIYNLDQRLSLLSFFDSITYGKQTDINHFFLKVPPTTSLRVELEREYDNTEQANKDLPFKILTPNYVPPNFSLTSIKVKHPGERGKEEVHLEYSDGLSTISFFQSIKEERQHRNHHPAKTIDITGSEGNLYHFGLIHLLEWVKGNLRITVVGEIEEEEMLKLANSVH